MIGPRLEVMKGDTYLSGIECTSLGYLLASEFHDHNTNDVGEGETSSMKPLVLKSVEQLWLKFHPHCQQIEYEPQLPLDSVSVQKVSETQCDPITRLVRFKDMTNHILTILEDVDKMKDSKRFLTREQREQCKLEIQTDKSPAQRRLMTLERQQSVHRDSQSAGEQDDGMVDYTSSTVRVIKTLNSIRLIVPLIVNILNHERRNDRTLIIGKNSISGETKKKAGKHLWMIGEYAYDIGSTKSVKTIRERLRHILRPILAHQDDFDLVMNGSIDWRQVLHQWHTRSQSLICNLLDLSQDQMVRAKAKDIDLLDYLQEESNDDRSDAFFIAVERLQQTLTTALHRRFRGCRLEVYGSCLANLSSGKSSDVDISIHIPELKEAKDKFERGVYTALQYDTIFKRQVYILEGTLRNFQGAFFDTRAVARARVPVVRGAYRFAMNPYSVDGSIRFDICFFNDIAVRNSTLIREYVAVCPQSKTLMMAVKKWAKDSKICSSADGKLSSYAWMILVIFFLQRVGMLPNLQCPELMKKALYDPSTDPFHRINTLNTAFVPWNQVKTSNAWVIPPQLVDTPVSVLMHGFFNFVSKHLSSRQIAASIRTSALIPKPLSPKCSLSFLCIEDPFETYDSHCPHELGSPATDRAQVEIMERLVQEECRFRKVLVEGIGDLWIRSLDTRDLTSLTCSILDRKLRKPEDRVDADKNQAQDKSGQKERTDTTKSNSKDLKKVMDNRSEQNQNIRVMKDTDSKSSQMIPDKQRKNSVMTKKCFDRRVTSASDQVTMSQSRKVIDKVKANQKGTKEVRGHCTNIPVRFTQSDQHDNISASPQHFKSRAKARAQKNEARKREDSNAQL